MTEYIGLIFFARKQETGSIQSVENGRILHTVLTIAKGYRCKVERSND